MESKGRTRKNEDSALVHDNDDDSDDDDDDDDEVKMTVVMTIGTLRSNDANDNENVKKQ